MQAFWRKKKKPLFDYFDDMEIAREFSADPFSEQPRTLSHADRRELLQEKDLPGIDAFENGSIHEKTEENES